jgi:hypothetical protein
LFPPLTVNLASDLERIWQLKNLSKHNDKYN